MSLTLDEFYDEAFPGDPYLSGVMRAEVDRMRAPREFGHPERPTPHCSCRRDDDGLIETEDVECPVHSTARDNDER